LLPLLSDANLISRLSDTNNSISKKTALKRKELKSKGKKFLDKSKGKLDEDSDELDEDSDELDKKNIDFLRECIMTINNSILSISGIDDSVYSKKSFRGILKSIIGDYYKSIEFIDLLGLKPSVVIELLDKEIINENIIDICLSEF